MFKKISFCIIIYTILAMFLLPVKASAQTNDYSKIIRVTPVILDINLKPGQQQTYKINIENLLNQPLGIGLSQESLDATDELTGMVFGVPHGNSPFVSWVSIEEKQFIISENSSKTISLRINVPKNAKEGSYTSILFTTPFFTKILDSNSPSVISKIGVLMLADIGMPVETQPEKMAKVNDFYFHELQDNAYESIVRLENIHNFNLSAKAKIEISPILFGDKKIVQLNDKRVLAGKIRKWQEPVKLSPGIYKAKLIVSLSEGRFIYADYFFTIPLLASIFKYLNYLLIIGFFVLIFLLRKRLKKAFKILYKGT